MRGRVAMLSVVASAWLGCASAPPAPRVAQATTNSAGTWSSASWEDRHDTMTFVVLPNMARLFQRFHGTEYPELTCRSCHGADADQVAFAMPHTLSPLDPAHMPDPRSRIVKFMADEVTPMFARLIEAPAGSVTCFSCHARREAKP